MENKEVLMKLNKIGACNEAVEWVISHGGNSNQIWHDCKRGDWMGWYLGKNKNYNTSKEFYLALAKILELQCIPIYKKYDKKSTVIIDVVNILRRYVIGKATKKELQDAAHAVYDAADAVYDAAYTAYAAAYTAYAAADAAYAAADAAYAAAHAAYAAAHAAYTADHAAYAAAYTVADTAEKSKSLKQSADIFRKYFPTIK